MAYRRTGSEVLLTEEASTRNLRYWLALERSYIVSDGEQGFFTESWTTQSQRL